MILLLLSLPFYFIPAFIAGCRCHKNGFAIFILNFFTGWTLLGWIAAFIWACVGETRPALQAKPRPELDCWDYSNTKLPGARTGAEIERLMRTPLTNR
jgi:hypothetical protein